MPPHIRCDGIPETGKFLPVESGMLGYGIRYSTQGIRNPASLTIESGIQIPLTRNPVNEMRNSQREIQERLGWPCMGWDDDRSPLEKREGCWSRNAFHNRPFPAFFFFNFWHGKVREKFVDITEKSALRLVKIAKFESDLLKINKDTAPQSREILQTFVSWGGWGGVGRAQTCPPSYKRLQIFATLRSYIFARLRRITFKFVSFTNIGALSSRADGFSLTSKVAKTVKRSVVPGLLFIVLVYCCFFCFIFSLIAD